MKGDFAVTGVGSLPFKDDEQALNCIASYCPVLPFVPQLPQRDKFSQMLLEPFRGFEEWFFFGEDGARASIKKGSADDFLAALSAAEKLELPITNGTSLLLAASASRLPDRMAVKGQIAGPLTVLNQLQYGGRPVIHTRELAFGISSYLAAFAAREIRALRQVAEEVVFVIDEPMLPFLRRADLAPKGAGFGALSQLVAGIRHAGAQAGLHCCAPVPGPFFNALFTELSLAVLSFSVDNREKPLDVIIDPQYIEKLVGEGGKVVWGAVPTLTNLGRDDESSVAAWLEQTFAAIDLPRTVLQAHSTLSAQCGLGLVSEEQCEAVFESCVRIAELVRHGT